MFQFNTAFAVPLVLTRMPGFEKLNPQLSELFLAKEAEGNRYANPEPFVQRNAALFESNFRLFDWPQACVQTLRDSCLSAVYRAVRESNGYDDATLRRLHTATESWFHITRRGGYFGVHNHPMHSWSGVYCVSHEGDDPATDSGKFVLVNPMVTSNTYIDYGSAHMKPPFGVGPLMIRLTAGDLLLFPSWLLHYVLPYEGDGARITVAFNVRFRLDGATQADVPLG